MPTRGYFNNASHGVPVAGVYDAMSRVVLSEIDTGPDRAAIHWADATENTRKNAALLINGHVDQIGFTSTTTTVWQSLFMRMDLSGKRVLVTEHEWYEYYNAMTLRGDITIEVLPGIDFDAPDLSAWDAMIDEDVAALMVPMVTSLTGLRYPVEAIGALKRPERCKFIVDGAQSLGQMSVDVQAIGCDAFMATGRKWLRGPRQTAFLWMNDTWGFSAKDTEAADQNIALRVGLGVAMEHALTAGIDCIERDILSRSNKIRNWAKDHGLPLALGQTGTVGFHVVDARIDHVSAILKKHNITAKLPNARRFEPLSCARQENTTVLRIAPHRFTTDSEIEAVIHCLKECFGN